MHIFQSTISLSIFTRQSLRFLEQTLHCPHRKVYGAWRGRRDKIAAHALPKINIATRKKINELRKEVWG